MFVNTDGISKEGLVLATLLQKGSHEIHGIKSGYQIVLNILLIIAFKNVEV